MPTTTLAQLQSIQSKPKYLEELVAHAHIIFGDDQVVYTLPPSFGGIPTLLIPRFQAVRIELVTNYHKELQELKRKVEKISNL